MKTRKKKDLLNIMNFVVWTLVCIIGIVLLSHIELPFVIVLLFCISGGWIFGSTLDKLFWKKKRLKSLKWRVNYSIKCKKDAIQNQANIDMVMANIDNIFGFYKMLSYYDDLGSQAFVQFNDGSSFTIDVTREQEEQIRLLLDNKLERDKHITIEKAIEIVENDGWIVDKEEEKK